ncbi:ABC transporter permease [Paenibacillus sp. Marseille-Q7038]
MISLLSSDVLKIRKKGLWFLVFFAPSGLVLMNALNFGLRLDYLQDQYGKNGMWDGLLRAFSMFIPLAIMLGATILSSMMASIEHQNGSWKQLLALPVSRKSVFLSKWALITGLLLTSCVLLLLGIVILGIFLRFEESIPWLDLLKLCFLPLAASLPMIVLLATLTMTHENQAVSVTLGVTLSIVGLFGAQFPDSVPVSWPMFSILTTNGSMFAVKGIIFGILCLLMGMLYFQRKEVS